MSCYPSYQNCSWPKSPKEGRRIWTLLIIYIILAVTILSIAVGSVWYARRNYYKKKRQAELQTERRVQEQEAERRLQEQEAEMVRQFQEREENIDMVRRAEEGHGDLGAAGASSGNGEPNLEWPWYRNPGQPPA